MPIVEFPTFPDKITGKEIIIGTEARGSIQKIRTYQISYISPEGDSGPPERVQLQYPYHIPNQPDSQAQLDRRQVFSDGMTDWSGLANEEKEIWNEKAREEYRLRKSRPGSYRVHSGCNLFMRDYLLTH